MEQKNCCCQSPSSSEPESIKAATKKTFRTLPSILVSFLIAFFPKCPICLAAYLSMFGSFELVHSSYASWLLPVLLGFLGIHLLMLLKKSSKKGYGPFLISLSGALFIIGARSLVFTNKWLLLPGILLILSGSLWNSFSMNRFKLSN